MAAGGLDEDGEGRVAVARLILGLRSQGIRDPRVLKAIETVPRELFVEAAYADIAYADRSLPIDCGQTISQPFIVAYMTEKLSVGDRDKVLEVGTGSGYQAAVLARLCRRVYTIERYSTLLRQAEQRFKALGIANITAMLGDGMKGWPQQAPFDRIIVTAAAERVPQALVEQLKVGGIMVLPVGPVGGAQHLHRLVRTDESYEDEELIPVRFVPLVPGKAEAI
ncbi:protein-L-isoaspartate(D-aspartate) O-methyltransferase [Tepidamorphus gemmatus]|jgi:protein-L-isoaspartate(D-aspartate) O-methyltransferase|uniref:Protein-L-isoaspartate O-methyltransferase n=1 Tax=Tepidamorphus gemmatus TaxID=747076 RepID=A0A4R3MFQ0_9HYPH|nr:protein-L-isoaspartate(D-aspartate) O-methyltransferase [Tepidamorphus gemmatus]TCT12401.1 protein-L-isoaspartate(D-aspartate) O-methyltransferase [Tepidamorphus gemmatus]